METEVLDFFYGNEYDDKRICVSMIHSSVTMNVELDEIDIFLNENNNIELLGDDFYFHLAASDITHTETNETEYGKELIVHCNMMDVIFALSEN